MALVTAAPLAGERARAQAPSFELRLGSIRKAFHENLEEQRRARKSQAAADIEAAARETQTLDSAAGQLRWSLQDLRRRAAWIDTRRGRDWFFEADLHRVRRSLRELRARTDALDVLTSRMAREARPESSASTAAARLLSAARGLRVECGRLADDGRWLRHELSRAGYPAEGLDLESTAKDLLMDAFNVENSAERLARKVNS